MKEIGADIQKFKVGDVVYARSDTAAGAGRNTLLLVALADVAQISPVVALAGVRCHCLLLVDCRKTTR